ncbi:hypothetical protein M011DRAFT_469727 [Sporormia fimetaria CBS 119925]|uniref:Glycoside hydrolase family 18 protein n=1 Tax=Sporormia fimetaria CBS 119925 TaxID=1340428 RepID=A0A6A6V624_9PLEO|nr:hypothetical protein M011DRAFT_469727 [Sporormia fimetaria CBS 119925]
MKPTTLLWLLPTLAIAHDDPASKMPLCAPDNISWPTREEFNKVAENFCNNTFKRLGGLDKGYWVGWGYDRDFYPLKTFDSPSDRNKKRLYAFEIAMNTETWPAQQIKYQDCLDAFQKDHPETIKMSPCYVQRDGKNIELVPDLAYYIHKEGYGDVWLYAFPGWIVQKP